ncbi:helix-turn-helix domain-containing protein [Nocardia sp. IBHARD005]|uniref:helix-turn-helix domain-containing protein n=1 Tax=Nocardia sp. IBHARD005 TaxID=3457765 RepID=UPI004059D500
MNLAADNYFAVVPEWVIDAEISDRAFRLWAVLRRRSDKSTGFARESRTKLATRLRTSVKSIDRALRELEAAGAITVHARWANAAGSSYSFTRDAEHSVRAPSGYVLKTASPVSGSDTGVPTPVADDEPLPEAGTPASGSDTGDAGVGTPVTGRVGPPVTHVLREVVPIEILSSATPPKEESAEPDRADVDALCNRLADRMIDNGCKPPTITTAWRREARLLLDRDGYKLDKALRLIDWCQDDPFWRANIRSMATFRRQYEQLRLKATSRLVGTHKAGAIESGRAWQE